MKRETLLPNFLRSHCRVAKVPLFMVLIFLENPEGHHTVQGSNPACTSCMLDLTGFQNRRKSLTFFPCFKRPIPQCATCNCEHNFMKITTTPCSTMVESQNSILPMEYFSHEKMSGDSHDSKYLTFQDSYPTFTSFLQNLQAPPIQRRGTKKFLLERSVISSFCGLIQRAQVKPS